MTTSKASKAVWAGRVITGLFGFFFAYNAMVEQMAKIGLPETILKTIAPLELLCAVIYMIPVTSVLGAVLLTGYLGGAILTHLRVGEPVFMHIAFGLLIWLGIYLREPRLHALLPFRKKV